MPLSLQLITPERRVLDLACDEVELPGEMGSFGVLPGHTRLIALLKIGEASYRVGTSASFLAIGGGFAEVADDKVTVLCDFAQLPAEIDLAAARRDQAQAEEEMKTVGPETFDAVHARLESAETRVQVAGRK
ncbi:MAG: ATP synthase F1 subunit epsilon [Thermoanaerobaculia bacterium]